jgi:hypothetical protein
MAASARWKWLGSSWRPRPHAIFLRRCDGDALDWRQTLSDSVSPQIRWTREQRAHGREDSELGLFGTQCTCCERGFWFRGRRFNHGFGDRTAARPWGVTRLAMACAGDVNERALRTGPWHVLVLLLRCFVRFVRCRHRGPACPEPLPSATSQAWPRSERAARERYNFPSATTSRARQLRERRQFMRTRFECERAALASVACH